MSDILIDANILIYFSNKYSPMHAASVKVIDGLQERGHSLQIAPQIVVEI